MSVYQFRTGTDNFTLAVHTQKNTEREEQTRDYKNFMKHFSCKILDSSRDIPASQRVYL